MYLFIDKVILDNVKTYNINSNITFSLEKVIVKFIISLNPFLL